MVGRGGGAAEEEEEEEVQTTTPRLERKEARLLPTNFHSQTFILKLSFTDLIKKRNLLFFHKLSVNSTTCENNPWFLLEP